MHSKQVRSNFLENYFLPIDFTINLHAKTSDEKNLNIIYNGLPDFQKVDVNNLYQKIDNYYNSDDSQLFDDYNFQIMGDYYIDTKYHYINKAQIDILETLND